MTEKDLLKHQELLEWENIKNMSKRQQKWLDQGVTQEGIENHLSWERRMSKEARERRKKNNEKNQELIKQIKSDLLNKTFGDTTILKINESVDGVGFWWQCFRKFKDNSEGEFRYFYDFEDYSTEEFIKELDYV